MNDQAAYLRSLSVEELEALVKEGREAARLGVLAAEELRRRGLYSSEVRAAES